MPKPAAGVHHHHAHLLLGEPEGARDARAEAVGALARRPQREAAVGARGRGDDPAGLDRDAVHPADAEARLHHDVGAREAGRRDRPRGRWRGRPRCRARRRTRAARRSRARAPWCPRRAGARSPPHRRRRVRRRVGILGDHRGHHLAHVAHQRIGEDRLRGRPEAGGRRDRRRDGPRALRQIARGVDRHDPGHGARGGGVDRAHPRVGVRAPHEGRVQHAGEVEILDVAAAAGDEALIFLAAQRRAERIVHGRVGVYPRRASRDGRRPTIDRTRARGRQS